MAAVERVLLLPLDQSVFGVAPDDRHDVELVAHGGLEVLHVHQEAGVAADRQHVAVGEGDLRADRTRKREAHGAEAVGDQTGVRLLALVIARNPHLVRADVGEQDVLGAHDLAHVPQHFLRLHRERVVVLLHGEVVEDGLAKRGPVVDVPQRQLVAAAVVELLVDLP